jgi:diguanylate cyclase (GGDEF)-like protein
VARDILDAADTAVLLERDGKRVRLAVCSHGPSRYAVRPNPAVQPFKPFEVALIGRDGTGIRGELTARPRAGQRLDPFGQTLAASLAAATCAALESIALNARLRLRAEIDPLTGLGNRRRLDAALARLQPGDAVLVLDLDHFKAVNDTLGHDAGDQVLRGFGAHLSQRTRAGELAIRTGGEEFVVIAAAGGGTRAVSVLLGRLAVEWWHQSPLTTFSAGAAIHPGGDPATTMKRADEALYEAKRRGRAAAWILIEQPLAQVSNGDQAVGRLLPFPGQPFRPREKRADIVLPARREEPPTRAGRGPSERVSALSSEVARPRRLPAGSRTY